MKRRFTILTAALALLAFLALPMGMRGQTRAEVVTYTLDGTQTGGTSGYDTESDITQNNISWKVKGNTTMNPWRIGGKNLSGVDRPLYSQTAITDNISKIEVTHGAASSITVNSWTVIVASDASFTNVVSTLTPNFAANATTTINRPTGADWSNCYFKFVYNVSVNGGTNRFVQFVQADFYKQEGSGPVIATPTFSPVGGEYITAQDVTISCETQGASIYYTTDGSTPDNTSTQYTTAIPVSSTTTINAIAYVGTDASSVATATYNIVQPLATMQAIFDKATEVGTTATYVYITLDDWVVSGVSTNGKNVFVTDGTKGFVIFDNGANMGFTAGDILSGTVNCKVQLYNGFAELTQLNSTTSGLSIATGGTITVANVDMADLAGVNTGALLHYDNLTCSVSNNKYYLSDGTTTLQVYNALYAFDALEDGKTYNITGIYQQYNSTKEILPRSEDDIEEVVTAEPSVTVTPNTINAPAEGADGSLALTYENITEFYSFDFYFCDATGEALQEDPDWIAAEISEGDDDTYTLDYIIDANDGPARTAYMKVYTFDDEEEEVYAIVTVNQAEYVAPVLDYAELPFAFDGGRADIETTDGLTQEGLDTDYASSPKLKFKTTGTWVILHFNERPGTLTFDIKGNSFSGGTFTVQTSVDGVTYTDLQNYTDANFGNTLHSEEFTNLGENVRYIKWIYTQKSSGNVALGNIALAEYVEPVLVASITVDPDEVSVDAEDHDGTLDLTYENLTITDMYDFDIQYYDAEGEEANEPDWMEVLVAEQDPEIGEGYVVSYWIMENEGTEARTVYFKVYAMDDETNLIYSNLVTVNQAAPETPANPGTWVLTDLADLTEDDIFVIVGDNGDTYAMSNDEGTQHAPSTVAVTVTEGTLSGEPDANIQWNLEITDDGYIFYPNGTTESWLYCFNDNNGVRVGTGDAKHFTLDNTSGYLTTTETTDQRYLGIYNSQDWRCYKNTTGNIAGQTFAFYKKVVEPVTATYTLDITGYGNSAGGYYLIASPVTVDPEDVPGMTEGNYDLFWFDQTQASEWQNYKSAHFDLVPGMGYLYAHKTDITLTLTGVPYEGDGAVSLVKDDNADFPGLNLVGNPFDTIAYIDRDFYTMNHAGSELEPATSNSIQAMEGIFVFANYDQEDLTFSTEAPTQSGEKIIVNVSNTQNSVLDCAIIRFGESRVLPKFQFNSNSTKLYFVEDGQEYAVVSSINENTTPVSFRAAENGTYTLNVAVENIEMEYLHLIDNITGADIDLLATPSYSFEANTTDNTDRFALVFATTTNVNENNSQRFAFFNGNNWVINNDGEATLQVVDVTGRVLSSETVSGNVTLNLNQASGVYMLRLVNGDSVKVQKVVVK